MTKSRGINAPRVYWTAQQLTLAALLYPDLHSEDVAALMGCSQRAIYNLAYRLKLRKSKEWLDSDTSARIQRGKQNPNMIASRFQPGLTPWNKGTHYTAGGRSAETRFKPGSKPHTTLPVGTYRLVTHYSGWQQLERKTSEAKGANHKRWTPVSRLVWEAAHGPVPKDHLVVFKPGKKKLLLELITLDRLECITRAENAIRNHPSNRSPELAKLVQLKGAITRQVNRINREAEQARSANP